MKKTKLRENPPRWCEVEIELKDGRLSICGSEGRIVTTGEGRKEALQYWEGFFEDDIKELATMGQRFGTHFRTPKSGAKFVLQQDGPFHGLDVHKKRNDRLYLTEGCGQITESIAEWFPEVAPYLKYHLNDMKAGCEHQEALGWGRGKDIALTADTLTPAQAKILTAKVPFKAKIYEDSISAPCPECGYEYGTKWLKRELPPEVNQFFAAFEGDRGDEG